MLETNNKVLHMATRDDSKGVSEENSQLEMLFLLNERMKINKDSVRIGSEEYKINKQMRKSRFNKDIVEINASENH